MGLKIATNKKLVRIIQKKINTIIKSAKKLFDKKLYIYC